MPFHPCILKGYIQAVYVTFQYSKHPRCLGRAHSKLLQYCSMTAMSLSMTHLDDLNSNLYLTAADGETTVGSTRQYYNAIFLPALGVRPAPGYLLPCTHKDMSSM